MQKELEAAAEKMRCLYDKSDLQLYGSHDSDLGSHLMIVFELCDQAKRPPGQKCKTDT